MGRAGLIAMWSLLLAAQPTSPPAMSVCDVLAHDPTILNGKLIKVRGILEGNTEGIYLFGQCKTNLVTKGLTWGNYLSIYADLSDVRTARSWEEMGKKIRRLRPHGVTEQDNVWVTFIGRLETRASMDEAVVQMPYGLARGGFGHMGGAPAEINVISVEGVAVEPAP